MLVTIASLRFELEKAQTANDLLRSENKVLRETIDYVYNSLGEYTGFLPPSVNPRFHNSWSRYSIIPKPVVRDDDPKSITICESIIDMVRIVLTIEKHEQSSTFEIVHFFTVRANDALAYSGQYNVSKMMLERLPSAVARQIRDVLHQLIERADERELISSIQQRAGV